MAHRLASATMTHNGPDTCRCACGWAGARWPESWRLQFIRHVAEQAAAAYFQKESTP